MHSTRILPFVLLAIMPFLGALRADDTEDRAQDIAQMKRVWEALMSYKKAKGQLPERLGALVPDHLRNPKDLVSPRDDGEKENGPLTRKEDKYPSSYGYEWGPQMFRGLTFTEIKTCQVEEYGPVVPLLRCFLYEPVLNISHAGDFYETDTNWEIDPAVLKIIKERGLGPGASKGQFVDLTTTDRSGAPLAGVKVTVRNRFVEGIWLPERTVVTGEDGRARIPFGPVQTMLGSLEFQKPGHFAFQQNGSPDGFKPSIKVVMNRTRPLSGMIVDSAGKPVAKANILIKRAKAEDAPGNPHAWFPTAIPKVGDADQIDLIQTDTDGKWITNLVADDPDLRIKAAISHESSAVKALLLDRSELERGGFLSGSAKITLPESLRLRGTLKNPDDSPAVGTAMFLYAPLDPTEAGRQVVPIETKSGPDGRFEFRFRVPGEIQVVVVPKSSAPLLRKANSSSAMPSMDLQLAAGRAIGGKVVDTRGRPVSGVQILFVGWLGVNTIPLNPVIATSDAKGKWQWDHAPVEPAWGSAICPSGELIYWRDTGNAPITITIPPSEIK
jgi:hypothetical protein